MSEHALWVFDARSRVGTVGYDSLEDRFSFGYAPQWRDRSDAYPLSPHLPLAGAPASPSTVRRFVENLLPEGRALDIASTTHRVSKNNVFGLIRELGRETAGALSFLPEGVVPESQPTVEREIGREELARRVAERSQVPFSVWDGRVRMSIAGYQDKLGVYMEGERICLVEGALASTHLLKPEPAEGRLPMLVANEHFCMRLAHRLGLPVAPVAILRLPDPVLVVERFDRECTPEGVRRIHVLDACQALDVPVSYKYERNFGSGADVRHIRDGVSFERLFSVTGYTARKALARQALTRWALFQYLVGNTDAHGKNVSFFSRPDGLALAPFYDLVSVVQYDAIDHELAMAYGDEFRLEDVTPFAWADFAKRTGLQRAFLAREMTRMARAAPAAAASEEKAVDYAGEERALLASISAYVQSQAQKLLAVAKPMQAVDPALL